MNNKGLRIEGDRIVSINGTSEPIHNISGWCEIEGYGTKFVLTTGHWNCSDTYMDQETKIALSKYLDNPLIDFADAIDRKINDRIQLIHQTSARIAACDRISDEIPRIGEQCLHLSTGSFPIGVIKSITTKPIIKECVIEFEETFFRTVSLFATTELSLAMVERVKKLVDLMNFVKEGDQLMDEGDIKKLKEFQQRNLDRLTQLSKPQSIPKVNYTKSYQAQLFVEKTLINSTFESLMRHIVEKVGDIHKCHFHLFKSPHCYHHGNLLWVSVDGMNSADHHRLLDGISGFESVAYEYEPHISPLMVANRVPMATLCTKVFVQGEADADFGSLADRLRKRLGSGCDFTLIKPKKQPGQLVGKVLCLVVDGVVKQQHLSDIVKMELLNDDFSIVDFSLDDVDSIVEFKE